jgi:hypothetical protein
MGIRRIRSWIEHHFTLILFLGLMFGLSVPAMQYCPPEVPLAFVSIVMFLSCSKIRLHDMRSIAWGWGVVLYISRFLLLPACLFWISNILAPDYALGVLLIALMPVGVSAAGLAGMVGACATVITSLLTPIIVPFMVELLGNQHMDIDPYAMFSTIALSIILPTTSYFGVARHHARARAWITSHTSWLTPLLMAGMGASVVGMQRGFILDNLPLLFDAFLLASALYALLFVVGWCAGKHRSVMLSKSLALCSGSNNIALAAAIAAMYFPPSVVLFTVVGDVVWVCAVGLFKRWADRLYSASR